MLNINDLETRQKKYKLKSYIPYLTIFISLTIISISAVFLFNYNSVSTIDTNSVVLKNKDVVIKQNTKLKENIDNNKTKKQEIVKQQPVEIKKELIAVKKPINKPETEVIVPKEEKVKLSPSLDFIRKIQSNTLPYYEDNTNVQKKPSNKPVKEKQAIANDIKEQKKIAEAPKLEIKKKASIKIERKKNDDDIQHVIKRFKVDNNPALSLFVAKKYYQLGEYDKAYNYALITNKINNNIEASWIVFAKSLVKLNKKDMAVKTLKKYIDHSHSEQAKLLLNEILSGKFK